MDMTRPHPGESLFRVCGLDLSAYDGSFLLDSMRRRQEALGLADAATYEKYLSLDPAEAEMLVDSLQVCYSRFFRDPLSFSLLETRILPALLAQNPKRSEIRVWSAGCASGQEAYSIAMVLEDAAASSGRILPYRIFATDLRDRELETARAGVYADEDVKELKVRQLETYFRKVPGGFAVLPGIRSHIEFSRHDLLDPETPHPPGSIFGDLGICFTKVTTRCSI